LKTLEEPPENVIFILATTEPHKVLDTIISRCQRFDFRRITTDDIVKRLEYVSSQENINIAKDALYAIAKNSQGGMRDALALLDQISVLGINKQIDTNDINEMLGKISYDILHEITECVLTSDCSKSIPLIDNIYAKGNEPVQIVSNLIRYFRDLMIVKNCTDKELIFSLTQINEVNYTKTKEQADKFSVSEIIQIIDKLSYYTTQIKDTTNKYLWLELCIIDLTKNKNLPSTESLLRRIENLEQKIESGNITTSPVQQVAIQKPQIQPQQERQPLQKQVEKSIEPPKFEQPKQPVQEAKPKQEQREVQPMPMAGGDDLHSLWISILQSIDSPPNRAFYSNLSRPVEISEQKIVIAFTKEMFVKQAKEGAKRQALVDAVSRYMNIKEPNIEVILSDSIDFSKKVVTPPHIVKQQEEQNIRKQDEEDYQAFVEAKKEEEAKPKTVEIDTSSQAAMVKELFDGKYIN